MDVSISMPWQDRHLYSFGTKYILLRSYDYGSLCKPLHTAMISNTRNIMMAVWYFLIFAFCVMWLLGCRSNVLCNKDF